MYWENEKDELYYWFQKNISSLKEQCLKLEEILNKLEDPETEFNFRHYLPGIDEINKRLIKGYTLYPEFCATREGTDLSTYKILSFGHRSEENGTVIGNVIYSVDGIIKKE